MKKRERILWGSAVLCLFLIMVFLFISRSNTSASDSSDLYLYARIFEKTFNIVRNNYVDSDKLKAKRLYFGAIEGMLKSLKDDHTTFLGPKIWKELHESLSGEFEGLGIHIGIRDDWLTVIAPIEGSPAYKKGLRSGDVIYKIEGKSTKGITLEGAVTKLRGPRGSSVTISIMRRGESKPIKVTITRDVIHIPSIKYTMINRQVGYIRMIQFQKKVDVDIRKAIKKLYKRGMKKLILDLRNNPGGYLPKAVNVVDLFISKGKIVSSKGRVSIANEEYFAHSFNTVSRKTPLIVLINGASASASEIVAGAIQDTRRGVIVGVKSYGKGSVQNVIPLSNGHEAFGIKLTTAYYYTSAGRLIHKKGIKPDIVIKEPELSVEELLAVRIIKKKKMIKRFVKRFRRGPSNAQIIAFRRRLKRINLPISLRYLKRLIYLERHNRELPPVVDLDFDVQLKEALKLFKTKPRLFKRTIKHYE